MENINNLSKSQVKQLISGKISIFSKRIFFISQNFSSKAFETKTLSIEVNKSEEASKIVYTTPFNSNIWAYHDSRLWLHTERTVEPTNDLSPALAE